MAAHSQLLKRPLAIPPCVDSDVCPRHMPKVGTTPIYIHQVARGLALDLRFAVSSRCTW